MSSTPEFPGASSVTPENAALSQPSASLLQSAGLLPENPGWSGWDVLRLALLAFVLMVALLVAVAFVSKRLLFPELKYMTVMTFPLVNFIAQVLAYGVLFAVMVSTVKKHASMGFGFGICWKCRKGGICWFSLMGVVTRVG